MLVKFKNGSGPFKNMAPRGRGSIPYIAIEKPCEQNFAQSSWNLINNQKYL
jgi:hypothetical protein